MNPKNDEAAKTTGVSHDRASVGIDSDAEGKETAGISPNDPHCKPRTFELAVLAELLTLRPGATFTPETAVLEALEFWKAAATFGLTGQHLRKLTEGLFTLTQEEWDTLVDQYVGDRSHLHDWLNGQRSDSPKFNVQNDVLRELFRAKNETFETRASKLGELLEYVREIGWSTRILLPDSRTRIEKTPLYKESEAWRQPAVPVATLLNRRLNVSQVRWLVNARQAFLHDAKSRPKPGKSAGRTAKRE